MASDTADLPSFIREILEKRFGRQVLSLAELHGGKNGLVFEVSVDEASGSASKDGYHVSQPGVSVLPSHPLKLVVRISNPGSMLNEEVRVQNEVAAMALMREALGTANSNLVPAVYGWGPSGDARGWVLIEHMPGEPLADKFSSLSEEKQRDIVAQIAQILAQIQSYQLPSSARGYGGLNFDGDGRVVVGATAIAGGGPCDTHAQLYTEYFHTQLAFADQCDIVQGWKDTDLRSRIDSFAESGLPQLLRNSKFEARPTLVHADFDTQNLLFDPETNRLTALLDYDFSHVGSQADEYLYSFDRLGGLVAPPDAGHPDLDLLRERLLQGFGDGPGQKRGELVDWAVSHMLDEELAKAGAQRPQEMPGLDQLSALYWFIQDVSPPIFFLKRFRDNATTERKETMRKSTGERLDKGLRHWGF